MASRGALRKVASGRRTPNAAAGMGLVTGKGSCTSSATITGTHRHEIASKRRPVVGVSPAATAQ
eukprot:scaffold32495_cov60-Phaeocystis_antarctica.AAC.11